MEGAADFRLLDRKVVDYLHLYKERDRFLRGIISDMGFRRKIYYYKENNRKWVKKYFPGCWAVYEKFMKEVEIDEFNVKIMLSVLSEIS